MKHLLLTGLIGLSISALAMEGPNNDKQILMQAAKTGNTDVIAWLYSPESGILIDVDSKDEDDMTPLHLASQRNHPETVLKLIEIGAQVDVQAIPNPRRLASFMQAMQQLGIQGDPNENGVTPLHLADSLEVTALLVVNGADIDAVGPMGATPLSKAICNNEKEIAQFLIEQGANIERQTIDGCTVLTKAIVIGNPNMLHLLVDKGANIHNIGNNNHAISIAALLGDKAIVTFLVSRGADVTATLKGLPLLHVAAMGITPARCINQFAQALHDNTLGDISFPPSDHKGVIAFLLDQGLDIYKTCYKTCPKGTALHAAAAFGKQELCETLLKGAVYTSLKENAEENHKRISCVFLCFQRLDKEGRGLPKELYVFLFSFLGREILSGAINTSTLESFIGDLTYRCSRTFGQKNYSTLLLAYCGEPARRLLGIQGDNGQTAADEAASHGHEELAQQLDPDQSDNELLKRLFNGCSENTDQENQAK